ncbi:MAG: hypothetical protein AAF770_00175 [Bacteroidota bacterium]
MAFPTGKKEILIYCNDLKKQLVLIPTTNMDTAISSLDMKGIVHMKEWINGQ